MRIKKVQIREILNCNAQPTVEVEMSTSRNTVISSVPIAGSKGKYEVNKANAHQHHTEELKKVQKNLKSELLAQLEGRTISQMDIDAILNEFATQFPDKNELACLCAISQAAAKLGAIESDLPLFKYIRVLHDYTGAPHLRLNSHYQLPKPIVTIFKSGQHNLENQNPLQEIFISPSTKFHYTKHLAKLFSDIRELEVEGKVQTGKDALEALRDKLHKLNSVMDYELGIDLNASRYSRQDLDYKYLIPNLTSTTTPFKGDERKLLKTLMEWQERYGVSMFEDVFSEDDYTAWHEFKTQTENEEINIIADDLTVTNIERLDKVSMLDCCNNVVIKPTQIGTVTQVIHFAQKARQYGHALTVSYRHGETEDTFISDLAVGINADYIRSGYKSGMEYMSKLNRLIAIESDIL